MGIFVDRQITWVFRWFGESARLPMGVPEVLMLARVLAWSPLCHSRKVRKSRFLLVALFMLGALFLIALLSLAPHGPASPH